MWNFIKRKKWLISSLFTVAILFSVLGIQFDYVVNNDNQTIGQGQLVIRIGTAEASRVVESTIISHNNFYGQGARHIRLIGSGVNYEKCQITSNTFKNDATGIVYAPTAGSLVNWLIQDNTGYISTGEIRHISVPITAGVQNTVTSIQNTFGGDVLIIEAYVSITTAASATNPTYDMGTDDDGAGAPSDGNNLFDAIPDTTGYYRALSNGLGGAASGVLVQPIIWNTAGGASDYVNFIIVDAAGADTAGYIYITVIGK